jgi:hypothetical protein
MTTSLEERRRDAAEREVREMADWPCNRARNLVTTHPECEAPEDPVNPAEVLAFLAKVRFGRLTPGEIDELARVDELKRQNGRVPHEL